MFVLSEGCNPVCTGLWKCSYCIFALASVASPGFHRCLPISLINFLPSDVCAVLSLYLVGGRLDVFISHGIIFSHSHLQ